MGRLVKQCNGRRYSELKHIGAILMLSLVGITILGCERGSFVPTQQPTTEKIQPAESEPPTRPLEIKKPQPSAEVKAILEEWKIQGMTETFQEIREDTTGADGKPKVKITQGYVSEVWFEGVNEPFKVGDRLPETSFTIQEIRKSGTSTGYTIIVSDTGETVILKLE